MKKENTVFQIRINDNDLSTLKEAANTKGIPLARYIKETMLKSAKRLIAQKPK